MPWAGEPAIYKGIKVLVRCAPPAYRTRRNEVTVYQPAYIQMLADEERSYGSFVTLIRQIGHFLSLGVSIGVQPFDISGFSPIAKAETLDGTEYDVPVQIFDTAFLPPQPEKDISNWQMLFSLPRIANEWAAILGNWLESAERLEPVLNVYFATLQSRTYIEHRFISLAQSLESYHRTVFGGSYMNSKVYKQTVYKQVKSCLPPDIDPHLRESLLDRARFAYEYVLRKRLSELLAENKMAVEKNIEDLDRFTTEVVATRNYLTHLGEAKGNVSATADAMDELADYLQFLMEVCLLRELGFDPARIRAMLDKDYRYNHSVRWTRFRIPQNGAPALSVS